MLVITQKIIEWFCHLITFTSHQNQRSNLALFENNLWDRFSYFLHKERMVLSLCNGICWLRDKRLCSCLGVMPWGNKLSSWCLKPRESWWPWIMNSVIFLPDTGPPLTMSCTRHYVKLLTSYWPHTHECQVHFISNLATIKRTSKGSMEIVGVATTQFHFWHDVVVGKVNIFILQQLQFFPNKR